MDIPRTLLVTNDFPPRVGGIQRTLEALWKALPPQSVSVLSPSWEGAETYDAVSAFSVTRMPSEFAWPSADTAELVRRTIKENQAEVVLFGDAFPLAALGPRLERAGTPYLVAAHGFDYWMSVVPGAHSLMRYMTSRASRVPVMCSRFIARTVRSAVPKRVPVSVLHPGAAIDVFRPGLQTDDLRRAHGIGDRPLVVCVSRLVTRKGQDVLINGMDELQKKVPDAALLIVGSGPDEARLRDLAIEAPKASVFFVGQVSEEDLPRYYSVGDVFAMPCRTRLGGLEVEGWGNVFIEAAACGKPVVVGDSGGARESLIDGETGLLVDGRRTGDVVEAIASILSDPARAEKMGRAGRARVERDHDWSKIAARLGIWLQAAAR